MKMRVISVVFCVVAFALSLMLMFSIYNAQNQNDVSDQPDVSDNPPVEEDRREPVSEATVQKLSSDVVDFINTLAYENDKSYAEKMNNYVEQLENSAEYLGSEMADEEGKAYLLKISSIFRSLLDAPYMNTDEFSAFAGTYLKEIETTKPRTEAGQSLYPQIDTDVNGDSL